MSGRYWFGTIPYDLWIFPNPLPSSVAYVKGQVEAGTERGYLHVQLVVIFKSTQRLSAVRKLFPGNWELSRSVAANAYVFKENTRVPDSQFELGALPIKRNSAKDWEAIRQSAKEGKLEDIPADVYIRAYNQLRRIANDHAPCVSIIRQGFCYWGKTGTGKSRRAWDEATLQAYCKDPRNKWWDGYQGEENVIIDEFRGDIGVSHILRWLDRYPVRVEVKGGSVPLKAARIWFTSNVDPRNWYPDLDEETKNALLRRLNITHFSYLCPINGS